ncbi:MAG TPA: glycosyltransferase [Candidatus Udaeobacter sp.]|nr:glycosyltransferase [Candidatus Udaeobacter sp.]
MKEAVVPRPAAGPMNTNPPLNESEKVSAFSNQREPIAESWGPAALEERRERTRDQLARIAARRESWINRNKYYYELLNRLFRFLVEPGKKVLSVRCGTGNLLSVVQPSNGKGIEICQEIVEIAQQRNPSFEFAVAFPDKQEFQEAFNPDETFDYILFNDIGDTVDVLQALRNLRPLCKRHTRVLVTTYNHLWEPFVTFAEWAGMKVPRTEQNWLSTTDVRNLLKLAGFEALETHRIALLPKYLPLLSGFLNRFCARLPFLSKLCMTQVVVARMLPPPVLPEALAVSVIIPCKNEKGNVEDAVRRIPPLAGRTELIFCDDQSTDGTAEEVLRVQSRYPEKNIRLEHGPGVCKSRNVWTGFDAATGDILMILDADLTTIPEELPYFVDVIVSGQAEFVNGSRLVYPVPKGAMNGANMLGNKFFSVAFTYLLGQRVKDTLCGTKVLWRSDWERIKPMLGCWGIEDRWGDYELLFGAAKLNLKILDLPVHYQERIYGSTKMTKVFRHGLVMLKMCWHGFLKLKLGY